MEIIERAANKKTSKLTISIMSANRIMLSKAALRALKELQPNYTAIVWLFDKETKRIHAKPVVDPAYKPRYANGQVYAPELFTRFNWEHKAKGIALKIEEESLSFDLLQVSIPTL